MPIMVSVDVAGGTQELFERVAATAQGSALPAGALFRVAGPIPGGWRVVSGWEAREPYERFVREQLQPAYQQAGVTPSRIDIWQVTEVLTASGTSR